MTNKEHGELRKALYALYEDPSSTDRMRIKEIIRLMLELSSHCGELEDRIHILEAKERTTSNSVHELGKRTQGLQLLGGQFDARLLPGSDDRYK